MKKIVNLTIVTAIIVLFSACEKDKNISQPMQIDPTEQKILNFKEHMQNPDKAGETMNIDSAVWYIEAALNYTYCYTPTEKPEVDFFKIDSFFVCTEAYDRQISFSNVITTYNQIKEYALTNFENFNGMNKFISAVDVEYIENKFSAKIITEYKLEGNKSLINGWIWGEKMGSCNGSYIGQKDASTEIYKYVKSTYPVSEMGPGYWTSITFPYFDASNAYNILYANNGPWYGTEVNPFENNHLIIYHENTTIDNYDRCLTIGDSYDWFKVRAWTAIQGAKNYQDSLYELYGTGQVMKSYFFTSRGFTAGGYEQQTHRVEFTYGIFHVGASEL